MIKRPQKGQTSKYQLGYLNMQNITRYIIEHELLINFLSVNFYSNVEIKLSRVKAFKNEANELNGEEKKH